MSYDRHQFGNLVERVLLDLRLFSVSAARLLLGTAAQESHFGTYLKQIKGPAVGAFQMEPATFEWLQGKYRGRYPEIAGRRAGEMEWDLRLAIVMARLRYHVVAAPLPDPDNLEALARYWKEHYNTPKGAGAVEDFVRNYGRYVLPHTPTQG